MWFQIPQWFWHFIQKAKEKWVSSNSQKRIKGHVMEAAAKSQPANWNKPNRNRNVTLQGALSANLVANRMWASVAVCREEVIQNSKFRHRPGLLPSKETVGRRGWGWWKSTFNPHAAALPTWVFPSLFFTELSLKQSFSSVMFTGSPHETGLQGKPVCVPGRREEMTGSSWKWDCGQPQQHQQPWEGGMRHWSKDTMSTERNNYCLAWNENKKKTSVWSRGGENKNSTLFDGV